MTPVARSGRRAARAALLGCTAIAACATNVRAQDRAAAPPPAFDAYVARVLDTFDVPGVAVAIVKDGKVVLTRGYGVRRLGAPERVDAQTRFGVASNTKAMTATALGILVDEGKIQWDAPVVDYLPDFRLWDPFVTQEVTVRDLLVHRSGLPLGAGDLLWWPMSNIERTEMTRRLRHLRPIRSFRTAYAYDNVLYNVAGDLIERVSGMKWEDFIQQRILTPIGMTTASPRASAAAGASKGENVATTHAFVDDTLRVVAPFTTDNANPAAGLTASAEDMAKWMIVQLDSGRVDGKRLWSTRQTRELWTLVTPMPIGNPPAGLEFSRPNFLGYSLGFNVRDYRGFKMVTHTGGLPGYVSQLTMIPELRLGVMVMTNMESGGAFNAITRQALDHYMNVPRGQVPDYPAIYARSEAASAASADSVVRAAFAARDSTSRPSLPLAKYAGKYRDPWYGDVTITQDGDRLAIAFGSTPQLVGHLEHFQHDTFVARWREREMRADAYLTFALNPDGSIDQAKMQAVSPATDFSFDFHHLVLKPVK